MSFFMGLSTSENAHEQMAMKSRSDNGPKAWETRQEKLYEKMPDTGYQGR
jgi:hypothetical protein